MDDRRLRVLLRNTGDHTTSFLVAVPTLLPHGLPQINAWCPRLGTLIPPLGFANPVPLLGDAPGMLGFADPVRLV